MSALASLSHVNALRCGVIDLVGDLDKSKASSLFSLHVARLNEPGAADLLEAYAAIQSPRHKRAILNLAKQLAEGKTTQLYEIEDQSAR